MYHVQCKYESAFQLIIYFFDSNFVRSRCCKYNGKAITQALRLLKGTIELHTQDTSNGLQIEQCYIYIVGGLPPLDTGVIVSK